jgi:ureidoacrylate peracid hydrolase
MKADSFSARRKQSSMKLNKGSTAILVVDMLNDFLKPGGKMVLEGGGVLIPPMRQLLKHAREVGIPVVYVNDSHRPGLKEDREFKKRSEHCIEGTWGAKVMTRIWTSR